MERYRSKTPDFHKEILIQPIITQAIVPVITTEVQPLINIQIQPVIHKEIQPIIHQEIQPIITEEIQTVITRKIQPVIFKENQTNIEEVIQKLEKSNNQNPSNIIEKHSEMFIPQPQTKRETKCIKKKEIQPYIMREEKHITQKKVEEKIETKIENIEIIEYVPYIQYKNGQILPYEKKDKKSMIEKESTTEIKSYKTSAQMMETIIAVNFVYLSRNYPMACKKTDKFSKIEQKLYQELLQDFPNIINKNLYFITNGNFIDKSLTFDQNKIKNGSTILIEEN